jgi:hypothetical protein
MTTAAKLPDLAYDHLHALMMFSMRGHGYQVILETELSGDTEQVYREDREQHLESAFCTFQPKPVPAARHPAATRKAAYSNEFHGVVAPKPLRAR